MRVDATERRMHAANDPQCADREGKSNLRSTGHTPSHANAGVILMSLYLTSSAFDDFIKLAYSMCFSSKK